MQGRKTKEKNRIMEEKKVLYSKRFPKESPLDLEKEIEQLNNEKRIITSQKCTYE